MRSVVFIGSWADYELAFAKQADPARYRVQALNVKKQMRRSLWLRLVALVSRPRAFGLAMDQAFARNPGALFLVNEREDLLRHVLATRPRAKVAILLRNPVASMPSTMPLLEALRAAGYPILSFDTADCSAHGFAFYNQYAAALPEAAGLAPSLDFAFIGKDKGRRPLIERLRAGLQARGFSVHLRFAEAGGAGAAQGRVTYLGYLAENLAARCLIEIMQEGQSGLTLRPLEAMVYGRKLLTNNPAIREEPFFHPDNVFVLDAAGGLEGIEAFMAAPLAPIAPEIRARYTVEAVIEAAEAAFG